jgi:hypothetical protein
MTGAYATNSDEIGNAMGNDPSFTASRSGKDKHRTTNSLDSFSLGRIKLSQNIHYDIIASVPLA